MVRSLAYAPGRLIDVYEAGGTVGDAPVVLLWHGSGVDERAVLAPLASEIAAYGVLVLVPDWRSDDPVAGSEELLSSVAFREEAAGFGGDAGRLVLAGWSRGASAAAWVALHPASVGGWSPMALVGLAGSFDEAPFTEEMAGNDLFDDADDAGPAGKALLVHGIFDTVVPVERSSEATDRLAKLGWSVRLRQVDTDHAGVVGTVYDPWRRRCVPTSDPQRMKVCAEVAELVAGMATV